MKVTDKLKVETEIPMKTVTDLQHQWQLDEHAVLKLKGFLQSEQAVSNTHINYKGTQLTIKYEEEIMFVAVVLLVVLVQIFQTLGMKMSVKLDRRQR